MEKLDRDRIEDVMALTPMQEGMLFHYLKEPQSDLYFEQLCLRITGEIEADILEAAWNQVVDRNEMLRTAFRWREVKRPVQVVLKRHDLKVHIVDGYCDRSRTEAQLVTELREKDRRRKFDLEQVPFRVTWCPLSGQRHILLVSQHHILYDGWSTGIILKEFLTVYEALAGGKSAVLPRKSKFNEFVRWLQERNKGEQQVFWKGYLENLAGPTRLPVKRSDEATAGTTRQHPHRLPRTLAQRAAAWIKVEKVTLASLLYTAWGILLYKYTGGSDRVCGTTVSGRNARVEDIEQMVGLFINTVPLRFRSSGDSDVSALAEEMNRQLQVREAFEVTPLADIKAYSGTGADEELFDHILVIENYPLDRFLADRRFPLSITNYSIFYRTNYDLTVAISLLADNEIEVTFTFGERRFGDEVIGRLGGHYERILAHMVEDSARTVREIEILTGPEKHRLLVEFNETDQPVDLEWPVQCRFEQQAEKTPWQVAVDRSDEPETMTYAELNRAAHRLAFWLRQRGAQPGSVTAVMMEPSTEMLAALLAVLKTGGAYLPIDPGTPVERIRYMLADSGARRLLTNSHQVGGMSMTALQNFESDGDITIVRTAQRPPIRGFDGLPVPDRSLINLKHYRGKIGMASVTNCISVQSTRGCPYECLFCHKIWSRQHVYRRAENIYDEIEYYFRNGVRNFAFIDDCFNLDRENSRRLFQLVIRNRMNIQLFFPNGLRGDIMTPDYIDLMVAAGTRGINLSLETASPRLQKLIRKHLDLDKFKEVLEYIAGEHPQVMLELASMHGFPTETEAEAMMTLNFIKDVRWLHFPYIHILKIFPNTEMERMALAHGISRQDILISRDRAFHELPETLPFPKSFTRQYQADFMNDYFLRKERLEKVLPVQMRILSEAALVQKYNAYLPVQIEGVEDILSFAQLEGVEIPDGYRQPGTTGGSIFDREAAARKSGPAARRLLLLDLSQHFSSRQMLYKVAEQPLGLLYLLTYLKERFGDRVDGRIYKSGNDFDSYRELREILSEYRPDLIGIRTLTFFKDFFHETVALLRQWGYGGPIITGGPYASSDYDSILKDPHVDLAVLGEGEHTLAELVERMLEQDFTLPPPGVLEDIPGIAFAAEGQRSYSSIEVVLLDQAAAVLTAGNDAFTHGPAGTDPAYVMYTSGSTGRPKGVMVEHRQINNCIRWMQDKFKLTPRSVVAQRTNLTFDPSVWEIFWPLGSGGRIRLLRPEQQRDAQYLIQMLSEQADVAVMYCPATLVTAMTFLLSESEGAFRLRLPWLITGAEPIAMETVKTLYKYLDGRIVNTYGPTECTINNTYYNLEPGDPRSRVPIGRPVTNNKIYVLSGDRQLVPQYVRGEICIAGESVARGYVNRPEQTAAGFTDHPFGTGKLYRSGDVGRWDEDGSLEILGRLDEQVKVRGYRIEPGEIEGVLSQHPSVQDCLVMVRERGQSEVELKVCRRCGITSAYPNVHIDDEKCCDVCRESATYRHHLDAFFGTPADLERMIREINRSGESPYDCLLLYAGGRGSAHALYRLADMGFRVLAVTYDNGYFSRKEMANIKMICEKLGVDHIALTHANSDSILRQSLQTARTVCRGCFHTSFSLAADYAYRRGIKVVVGATLSRGQIIENKVFMFLRQGITDVAGLERSILNLQKSAVEIDKKIFDHIDIDAVKKEALYEKVKFIDFYRYEDLTNEEMIRRLNERDPYWKSRREDAVYSTNCPLKQIGDFAHLQDRGFHFYGSAASWEVRLDHLTPENVKDDLTCPAHRRSYERFCRRVGYRPEMAIPQAGQYLCAYFVSSNSLGEEELKQYLSRRLPGYMVPAYLVKLESLPLLTSGKVDRRALPEPESGRHRSSAAYVAPDSAQERQIAAVWQEILKVDRVGLHDNFFDLGGNSLNVIQVSGRLRELMGRDIPVVTLFTYPTVGLLAAQVKGMDGAGGAEETENRRFREREAGKDRLKQRIRRQRPTVQ